MRIRVANRGNATATNVEVMATELYLLKGDNWTKQDRFQPLNLKWSNVGLPAMPVINPGTEKLCDIGHIIDPKLRFHFGYDQPQEPNLQGKATLSLDLEVLPFTWTHILSPGSYRLRLVITCGASKPLPLTLQLKNTGNWHENEQIMIGQCVTMELLESAA